MDSNALREQLNADGFAVVSGIIDAASADGLREIFDANAGFRKTIEMERHGYGRGTYRYFAYPLPAVVQTIRERLYVALAPIANDWSQHLGSLTTYPASLDEMLQRCHDAGQLRPTPLVLSYETGDFNALHQDVYGAVSFPFQATMLLSRPDEDFTGGEFILYESRARRQSVARVVPLSFGDAVIFPNVARPNVKGGRSQFRHGVSTVRSGRRVTLGVILHDAQ